MHSSALGKAILAWSAPAYVDDILNQAATAAGAKIAKGKAFDIGAELKAARTSGIAYSRGEAIAGVDGFAAPVFNAAGVPIASLGIGIPTGHVTSKLAAKIEAALKKASRSLSIQLGWQGELPPLD